MTEGNEKTSLETAVDRVEVTCEVHPRPADGQLASAAVRRYTARVHKAANGGHDGMPIYEYRCHRCHHEFEELARSMSGRSKPVCPECGGTRVSRKQSVFAAHQASGGPCPLPDGACGNTACASGEYPMTR